VPYSFANAKRAKKVQNQSAFLKTSVGKGFQRSSRLIATLEYKYKKEQITTREMIPPATPAGDQKKTRIKTKKWCHHQ